MRQVQLQSYIGNNAERRWLLILREGQGHYLLLFGVRIVWLTLFFLKHSGAERI